MKNQFSKKSINNITSHIKLCNVKFCQIMQSKVELKRFDFMLQICNKIFS